MNPKCLDGPEKEVCDLLFVLREQAIFVQMKTQEDPLSRSGSKLESWIKKQAGRALDQLGGTIRTLKERSFSCIHPRRGRVEFSPGELALVHGVILVENIDQRLILPPEFPLECKGLPISYFSTNDFLNIIDQLIAFPEIRSYLELRSRIPHEERRAIGGEKVVYQHFILNGGSFETWRTYEQAKGITELQVREIDDLIRAKSKADIDADFIEYVVDTLAERSKNYRKGLSQELLARFDSDDQRRNYLRMQEELCDLSLADRRILGMHFRSVIQKLDESTKKSDMTYAAAWGDAKPDFLCIFAASRGVPRPRVLERGAALLAAGLAFYEKASGMFIIDRDGESFEVRAILDRFVPTEQLRLVGKQMFGSLRISDVPSTLVPTNAGAAGK